MKTPILRAIIAASLTVWFGTLSSGWAAAQTADDIIRSFNQAKRSGSIAERVSASEALGAFAIANPDEDDAFILGYEAAQTLCRLGECAAAVPITDWLATQAPDAEVEPTDLAVLIALANWSEKPRGKQRKALDEALGAIVDRAPSLLSVVAFQRRYLADLGGTDWDRITKSAGDAAAHFEPFKNVIGLQWSNAKTNALAASFNSRQTEQIVLDMAQHEVDLNLLLREEVGAKGEAPDWISEHRHTASAWRLAMEAFFTTKGPSARARKLEQKVDAVLGEFASSYQDPPSSGSKSDPDRLPFCDGEFNMRPALTYPASQELRGQFGAALMRISIRDGKVSTVEPLAAVPIDGFKESAAKTIMKWSWKTSAEGIGETCGLDRDNIVLPLIFALN